MWNCHRISKPKDEGFGEVSNKKFKEELTLHCHHSFEKIIEMYKSKTIQLSLLNEEDQILEEKVVNSNCLTSFEKFIWWKIINSRMWTEDAKGIIAKYHAAKQVTDWIFKLKKTEMPS